MSDVDTTNLGSEAKTVDLTRYRKCEHCYTGRIYTKPASKAPQRMFVCPKCDGGWVPDDSLQQIADAYKAWIDASELPIDTDELLGTHNVLMELLDGLEGTGFRVVDAPFGPDRKIRVPK